MKFLLKATTTVLFAMLAASTAHARDTRVNIPLSDVIELGRSSGKLDGSVRFFLQGAATPAVERRLGEGVSNKKTNAANKSDEEACRWAALSALIAFQESARSRGANAVVNIISYYKKNAWQDPALIECHAGAIMAGVALKGEYARVAE
ncbi:MAG: phosphoribosylglycinamide formyltransferase [Lysobacteraceae bacterium]|nr:MAG: phosphoribosylglycinamide formyltransferase [Xanthomonadaceae bacterium]